MNSRSSAYRVCGDVCFHFGLELRGPVIVERVGPVAAVGPVIVGTVVSGLSAQTEVVTLPNLKPLLDYAQVLERDRGDTPGEPILEGPEGRLSIPAADLLAFVAHVRECYPRSPRPEVPEFYRLTSELRWLIPGPEHRLAWQPFNPLQQRWEHIFGFEPDVWLPVPVVESPV